jgi:hypothetical protein
MDKWEYRTQFVFADSTAPGAQEHLLHNEIYPGTPPVYAPESMEVYLNRLGAEGWEIITMQPVPKVGKKRDVGFPSEGTTVWSNAYFLVMKRRKADPQ